MNLRYIDYTEPGENHGSSFLMGFCTLLYILVGSYYAYRVAPFSQSSKVLLRYFLVIYEHPLCFPFNATLLIRYALYIIVLKTLHHPCGEGVSTQYFTAGFA